MFVAANKVIEKGKLIAGHLLEADKGDIEFSEGNFTVKGTDKSVIKTVEAELRARYGSGNGVATAAPTEQAPVMSVGTSVDSAAKRAAAQP